MPASCDVTEVNGVELENGESKDISEAIQARRPGFLANRLLDLQKMRDAFNAKDFAAIRSIGHNCKGIGRGYGFPEVSEVGAALEIAAKELHADKLLEAIGCFDRCIQALSRELAQNGHGSSAPAERAGEFLS